MQLLKNKTHGIFGILLSVSVCLIYATIFAISYFFYNTQTHIFTQELTKNAQTLTKTISNGLINHILEQDISGIEESIKSIMINDNKIASVKIWNSDKKIILNAKQDKNQTINLQYHSQSMLIPNDDIMQDSNYITIFNAINEPKTIGYIQLQYTLEELKNLQNQTIVNILVVSFAISITAFAVVYFLSKYITYDIVQISEFASNIDNNKGTTLNVKFQIKELSSLADSLNNASLALKKSEDYILEQNANLQDKIKEEVEKNLTKDVLLEKQSRLAMMGEMISNIAHQWRQPLNILGLILQEIALKKQLGKLSDIDLNNELDDGQAQIMYMSKTIDDFRSFFRPDKEKVLFEPQEYIDYAISIIHQSLTVASISIEKEFLQTSPKIYGFPNEFAQVVLNILNNSKDAIKTQNIQNGFIKIGITENENTINIYISDNGGGISNEIIDKIFDPYFTTKSKLQGTGIGLYMSKMIIEKNMGGTLNVHNIDNGVRFDIILDKTSILA